ncbi:DUF2020 domain-containing protein [Dietzia sp. ANT_WB102]|uniref:DUF2020 domain-containing protein n=1 Tax=Dietzia sp. ANT_WB102 TaxID=2597345 RepID=UPI0011EBC567|nr:DUF2020 domain-containing protein [Dietzia sp. ANT_WB102]KAA0918669.1 DUF2020 domain-containing protein [Dietzia sp. ANT_WB102]
MRRSVSPVLATVSAVLVGALAGCGGASEPAAEMGTIRTAPPEATEPELPRVDPVADAECPYLSAEEVSRLNGVPATDVRIDDGVDPAACFFYDAEGAVQLTTTVYSVASAERAAELVEESAPAGESDPSEAEGGWSGGRTGGPGGSLLVLARGAQVLAVQSTQEDSVTVQQIAELVGPRVAD